MIFQPKEGQIFEHYCMGKRFVLIVTGRKSKSKRFFNVIMQDGYGSARRQSDFEKYRLIAEYPTWQEAVNSKEFKE